MRFFGTTLVKFAVVATDHGMFKVLANGTLEMYDEGLMEFEWFDETKFNDEDLAMVRQQGLATLGMS